MTALGTVASILGVLYPQARGLLWVLAVLFFLVAAFCFYRLIAIKLRSRPRVNQEEKRFRRFTNSGITSELIERKVVNDHAEATLRIRATNPNIELPQPLEILINSTEIEAVLDAKHYPSETDDLDQGYPGERGFLWIRLRSPRLYGSGHLDIRLRAKGPSLSVQGVKRNPK